MSKKSSSLPHAASGKSDRSSIAKLKSKSCYPLFAMCVDNKGNVDSLMIGKVYKVIRPEPNDGRGDMRVIDEEGEDYLYSVDQFVPVELPPKGRRALATAV
jgi:hypothetical protein